MFTEFKADNVAGWNSVVSACDRADFHHTAGFHQLANENGEGDPVLLDWRDGSVRIALPLLLRSVTSVPGLADVDPTLCDATSVYGYCGPVWSGVIDGSVIFRWQTALRAWCRRRKIVTLFGRLHPLWDQTPFLSGLGSVSQHGRTVSIDLTLPVEQQRAAYRDDHKRGVNKLRRLGYTVEVADDPRQHLARFAEIYLETMQRVGSTGYYLFDRNYFERLADRCPGVFRLFAVWSEGVMAAAGLFSLYRGTVQFHLSGTDAGHLKMGPSKLMIDEVRLWAVKQGASVFHLGGGLGGQEDSLFGFKAGFSDRFHTFRLWTWECDPHEATRLVEQRRRWHASRGELWTERNYYPAYRQPLAST